jgi:hypothetical protein
MKPNMRRNLPGSFLPHEIKEGAWRLSRSGAESIEVFLKGADPRSAEALRAPKVADIDIEWQPGAVALTMTSAGRRRSIQTHSAIVHEPLAQLYETLPLAVLDAKAQAFWRRVFLLVRMPGGRYLLLAMARRNRAQR